MFSLLMSKIVLSMVIIKKYLMRLIDMVLHHTSSTLDIDIFGMVVYIVSPVTYIVKER